MNKIHILNPPSQSEVTRVYCAKGQTVSTFVLTISIYVSAPSAKRSSFPDKRLVELQVIISELEMLSCTHIFDLLERITDSKGNNYLVSLDKVQHMSQSVFDCVSIPSLLQLISKVVLFKTGNTVIFELKDYVRKFQSKIGPLFHESSHLEDEPSMEHYSTDLQSTVNPDDASCSN